MARPEPPALPAALAARLAAVARRRPQRAGSLVITLFGDAVLPRGGAAALDGVRRALAPFGVNDSQLRTAVSRLVADGWLEGARAGRGAGRRAVYALTAEGRRRAAEATWRIYAGAPARWSGGWTLAALRGDGAARAALRRRLGWLGFGTLAPNLVVHPAPEPHALASALADPPRGVRPLVFEARLAGGAAEAAAIAAASWDLGALARGWRGFVEAMRPVSDAFARGAPDPFAALVARVLLIHEYRRILLHDPLLPPPLLPPDWPGHAARELAARLYRRVAWPAEAWLDEGLAGPAGWLPRPAAEFARRFGGLGAGPGAAR
jgi:phenylacetic acid degradation operon negative regulatory protein